MRIETHYYCEVCGGKFTDPADAQACEDRKVPDVYPVGMLYMKGNREYTFAVAMPGQIVRHDCVQCAWLACPDWGHRDLLPSHVPPDTAARRGTGCVGTSMHDRPSPPDLTTPASRRMIASLRTQNITPTVWDGTAAVPLPEGS